MRLSVGTHNLLDGKGRPTPFADLLLFTEAVPADVRRQIGDTHEVRSCPEQRDLTLAWRRSLTVEELGHRYVLAHGGIAEVTPHRGTWVFKLLVDDKRIKIPITHRINAAYPPYKRGEAEVRAKYWKRHYALDNGVIRRAIANEWDVIAGGDLNTPPHRLGYAPTLGLAEERKGLDRIAITGKIAPGSVVVGGYGGSDHPRLRLEVIL